MLSYFIIITLLSLFTSCVSNKEDGNQFINISRKNKGR